MKSSVVFSICLLILAVNTAKSLEPNQILVIANKDIPTSMKMARQYCHKRAVPTENILALSLGQELGDTISRTDYNEKLVKPIRARVLDDNFIGKIRCLLTTYGVPIKAGRRGPLKSQQNKLKQLKALLEQEKNKLQLLNQDSSTRASIQKKESNKKISELQSVIGRIAGVETNASVDSELSMLLFDNYDLYRWKPNKLRYTTPFWDYQTIMVCRLDGPSPQIAISLADKAISAEKTGLRGIAYIDSRGIADSKQRYSFGYFDRSLRNLAVIIRLRTDIPVIEDRTAELFAPGACPKTAIYCGWYSLKKYVDAFDFVDGAIGFHISSLEAVNLRDPNSSQWCPAMLKDGVTATLGAVAEPYLHSFPEPSALFNRLLDGYCLVEAYYYTKPFNSWQLMLIGDPLYRPFKKARTLPATDF